MEYTKRVSDLIVAKDVATNGSDGFVEIVDATTLAVLTPGDTITDSPRILFRQITADSDKPRYSQAIDGAPRGGVVGYKGKSFRAKANKIVALGNDGVGTDATIVFAETEYFISVVFRQPSETTTDPLRYSFTSGASATQESIVDQAVALLQGQAEFANYYTTIAKVNNGANFGITIEGAPDMEFDVALGEGYEETAIATTQVIDRGSGGSTDLAELENFVQGFRGYHGDRTTFVSDFPSSQAGRPPSFIIAGTTYDIYVIEHNRHHASQGSVEGENNPEMVYIAIPAGPSNYPQVAAFEATLNPWMASTPQAFPAKVL